MRGHLVSGISMIAVLMGAAQASAQTAAPVSQSVAHRDDNTLDEVVVTSERFGSGLARATFTVGAEDIQQRPAGADITQSLVKVPGVQVSTGDSRGGSFSFEIYLRGLSDEQIGLTLDGIPTGDSRFNGGSPPQRFIESSNIGKITVSQSSGDIGAPSRFALGGFIDFVTDKPKQDFGVTLEGGAGSFDFWRGYVRVDSGEIAKGLTAYATASKQENDIWAGQRSRHSKRAHYEAKIVKAFEDGSSLTGRLSYNDQTDNDFNIVTKGEFLATPHSDRALDDLTGIPARDIDFGGALGGKRKDLLAYINGRFKLAENVTLGVNPYYQTLKGESYRYQDRQRILTGGDPRAVTSYNAAGGAVRPTLTTLRNSNVVGGPADMRVTPRDRDRYGLTAEIKADNLFAGQSFRIGGWWEGGESTEKRNFYPIINSAQSIAYNRSKLDYVEYERTASVDTLMFYAQDEIRALDDRLKVDLGLTFFHLKYDAKSPLEYKANVKFSQDSKINPKLGASYKLTDAWEVFGGYATGFSGIPEDAFLGSTAVINPDDLDPVETRNFDLGLRWVRDNAAFSVQGYDVHLKNNVGIVPRDPTSALDPEEVVRGNVATRAANTAGQKSRGVEFTGFYDFGAIDVYGSLSLQDAKHDDPPVGSTARKNLAAIGIIGGAGVRDIPKTSFFAQVGWQATSSLKLDVTGRYVGDRVGGHIIRPVTFDEIEVEKIDGYALVGLSAAYDIRRQGLPDMQLQFNIDNLFDETYISAVSGSTATQPEFGLQTGPTVRTLDRYFLGAPRTYTASLRVRF